MENVSTRCWERVRSSSIHQVRHQCDWFFRGITSSGPVVFSLSVYGLLLVLNSFHSERRRKVKNRGSILGYTYLRFNHLIRGPFDLQGSLVWMSVPINTQRFIWSFKGRAGGVSLRGGYYL